MNHSVSPNLKQTVVFSNSEHVVKHISSLQLAVKQLPTFVSSEARYASNASRSSGTVRHLRFDSTANPAALHIPRISSRSISDRYVCAHSNPLLHPSSTKRCNFSRGCDMTQVQKRAWTVPASQTVPVKTGRSLTCDNVSLNQNKRVTWHQLDL